MKNDQGFCLPFVQFSIQREESGRSFPAVGRECGTRKILATVTHGSELSKAGEQAAKTAPGRESSENLKNLGDLAHDAAVTEFGWECTDGPGG